MTWFFFFRSRSYDLFDQTTMGRVKFAMMDGVTMGEKFS